MKKGYICPSCGNKETSALAVILPGRNGLSVLMVSSKLLNTSDVQICCYICKHQSGADSFRTKRGKGI
jgi:predicted nucleic-acid-binding Zn-ribbon protein